MTSPKITVAEISVRTADTSVDAVAERVVALLDSGEAQVVDFADGAADATVIRAVAYPGPDLGPAAHGDDIGHRDDA